MAEEAEDCTIVRLAVVAKDYQTYYIPGITMIANARIMQIREFPECYECWDSQGCILSKISKDCPCLVDYKYPD